MQDKDNNGLIAEGNLPLLVLKQIMKDLDDLGFDYDRMSSSGQETYDRIQTQIKKLAPTLGEALHFYNDA